MRKARHTLQDDRLKELLVRKETDIIDVRLSVMDRVRELHSEKSGKKRMRHRTGAIIAIASLIVVLTSLTGYAASRYVQIINSKGKVIVETKDMSEDPFTPQAKTNRQMRSAYKEHVEAQLKPGELAAYYVDDDTLNAFDKGNEVQVVFKPFLYASFAELKKQLEHTAGPLLAEPKYLPKGYSFEEGKLYPDQMEGEASVKHLRELKPEFVRMAASSSSGAKLFVKPLSWNKSGTAYASYAKGENQIIINAYTRKESPSSVKTMVPKGVSVEKLTAGGQEMIYMEPGESAADGLYYKHKLEWLDEKAEIYYSVYDNSGSTLSKSEFIRVVASMVK